MAYSRSQKFEPEPGLVKQTSMLDADNRWVDSNNIRWVRRKPQKIGGWTKLTEAPLTGTPRGMLGWSDGTARQLIATGTETKLYAIPLTDYTPIDITPFARSDTLTDRLTTTNGSATVTVYYEGHEAEAGRVVKIEGASAFNNVTIDGLYEVVSVTSVNAFTITAGTTANASGSGGGAVTVSIEIDPGYVNPQIVYGWGAGSWGSGTWGSARAASSLIVENRQWSLDAFGRILLAAYNGGPLFKWDPLDESPEARASKVTDSPYYPQRMNGFIVTPERIVIAWGTDSSGSVDLLEVWTSRQGDYTDWDYTGLPNDQGAQSTLSRLQFGKKVVGGASLGGNVTLLWTDAALYIKQYTGSSNVFSTRLVGTDCGLLAPMACAVHNGAAYWLSESAFFMYDGGMRKIPNGDDMAEWVFTQLRATYNIKAFAKVNPRFGEVWFWFVPTGETEPTIAAIYNYAEGFWFHCTMSRTSIAHIAGQSEPIMSDSAGDLYLHETGVNANGSSMSWYVQSGVFELDGGDSWPELMMARMDMQRQTGDITLTFRTYDGVPATETVLDTQTVTAAATDAVVYPRMSGRQVDVKFSGTGVGCDVRFGIPRFGIRKGARR